MKTLPKKAREIFSCILTMKKESIKLEGLINKTGWSLPTIVMDPIEEKNREIQKILRDQLYIMLEYIESELQN